MDKQMNQKLSILIVDDDDRFRQGIVTFLGLLRNDGSIEVVGEANNVDRALKLAQQKQPDLILLDLELAGSDGITALIDLKDIAYSGKVLVLSGHQEDEWIFRAMQAGASGYVFKSRVANQLCDAIDTVLRSEIYLPTEVASRFFRLFQTQADASLRTCHKLHLTEREREVLYWLNQGASNALIAKQLYVTVATVKAHLTSVFEKLEVTSRTQAIIAAVNLGLLN
jgi:DNA-binding NarL/FixJ family response regulator